MLQGNTIHKYWKTAGIVSSGSFHDNRWGLAARFMLRVLRVVILLSLWRSVFANRTVISGMSLDAVMTYTLIAEVFANQMTIRTALSDTLWEGIIVNRLLRPIGIYGQFIAEMIGDWVPGLVLHSLPLLLMAPFLGVRVTPASSAASVWFIASMMLGVSVGAALDVLYAALMVYLEQSIHPLMMIRDAVSLLASGAVIPLVMWPWSLGEVLGLLPFASLASAPLRIYTGTGDPGFLIGLQVWWTVVLWPAAHILWRHNRERLASHGG